MSFLIFAVLAMLLFGSIANEAADSRRCNEIILSWREARGVWLSRSTDESMEEQYEYYLKTAMDYAEIDKTIDRICPCVPIGQRNINGYMRILLSQRGKVTRSDAVCGIDTPAFSSQMPMLICKQKRREFNNYIRWLDNELRKHGMQERIIFEPMITTDKRYYTLDECSCTIK